MDPPHAGVGAALLRSSTRAATPLAGVWERALVRNGGARGNAGGRPCAPSGSERGPVCPGALRASEGRSMLDAQRSPLGWWPVFALAHGRAVSLAMALLGLSGCLAHQEPSRSWLVYAREVPVARVTLAGASHGNVVDVSVN